MNISCRMYTGVQLIRGGVHIGISLLHHHAYYLKEVGSVEREKLPSLILISEY